MPEVLTPRQAAARTRALGKSLHRLITRPMDVTRNLAAKRARAEFRSKSPGRSIFVARGQSKSGKPPLLVRGRAARLSKTEGAFLVSVAAYGMAAHIEEGKPTKRHTIKAKRNLLAFSIGGASVFAKRVAHPGSRVKKNPILRTAAEKEFRGLPQLIDRSLQDGTREAGLA